MDSPTVYSFKIQFVRVLGHLIPAMLSPRKVGPHNSQGLFQIGILWFCDYVGYAFWESWPNLHLCRPVLPKLHVPSYRLMHELKVFLEIIWGGSICLTYFHCPHICKHSLKALHFLIFVWFHSMFLQFLAGLYLQSTVWGVLLTSTCRDWFQKDGAGLALKTFADLIRKGCGREIAAFFPFPAGFSLSLMWDMLC